jgi:glycosyltransferase involved in cell wall biosynthesis
MKIGYFTNEFPYKNPITGEITKLYCGGGVGEVVFNLAIQMAKRGHEIYIFTTAVEEKTSTTDFENIHIIRYKSYIKIGMASISPGLIYEPLFSNIKLDIIHAHLGNIPGPIGGYLYSKCHHVPLIITHHGDVLHTLGNPLYRSTLYASDLIMNFLLSKSDRIIVSSKEQVGGSQHLGKYWNKTSIIPNGINSIEFEKENSKEMCRTNLNIPLNKKIILFVGVLSHIKGLSTLLKALRIIKDRYPDVCLVVVGDGNYKKNLISLTGKLGLEQNIIFPGYVFKNIEYYYNSADLFALPSFSEGYPLVLLEASAAGLPLVVSDLECLKAIVHDGENGLITVTGDEHDLAEKILTLLNDEKKCQLMGRQAKKQIKHLSWESVSSQTEEIYLNI